ncbi:D-alanyl-lipoteichoic acid biosynthesis protein DltD, partial [Coprococcus eutactus]
MPAAFKYYNGTYANLVWLKQANPNSPYDRYTAKRLVKLLGSEGSVANYAKKIADGKSLSSWDRTHIDVESTLLKH